MRRCGVALCIALLGPSALHAQTVAEPEWAIFGMPLGERRGDSASLARLDSDAARDAYLTVVEAAVTPERRGRTRLGLGWLPDSGGYRETTSGEPRRNNADSTFIVQLATNSGLKGVCVVGRSACYRRRQAVLLLSRLFRAGPDALRVFALWETEWFATEQVLLLRQVNGRWAVVAARTVMIT
jgi:hypothetical protein